MAVELTVTSTNGVVNLTQFLDVEEGKGMEPGDPKFTEKVFARSLLKQGATLALESLHEKEMVFPVKLHAASKEALTGLVQEVNTIVNSPGAQVKWRDEGASEPTYFDLISGQFDDEFDFRLGQNNWLKGRLRLFTQPLGYNVQSGEGIAQHVSGVATTTKVGTGPIVVFTGASPVAGDAPALIAGRLTQATQHNAYWAMSALPTTGYTPLFPAASAHLHNATVSATSNSIGGTIASLETGGASSELEWQWPTGNLAPAGLQRFLLICKGASPTNAVAFQLGEFEPPIASQAAATVGHNSDWQTFDLGVYPVPSMWLMDEEPRLRVTKAATTAGRVDIAGVIMLPDSQTSFVRPEKTDGSPIIEWDGNRNRVCTGYQQEVSVYARGAIPQLPAQATAPPVIAFTMIPQEKPLNDEITAELRVLPRCRYSF